MGVVLACPRDALPGEAAAFLIIDHERRVCAVSEAGERYFGSQDDLIGRDLLDLLTSPLGDDQLCRNAELAAQRPADPVVLPLRLVNGAGAQIGTMAGRIATCGPPRAALITVEPSEFGRR